jgi:transcription initiation factor TFIIIB Brf1 subunit/transcription initiation factor TFIIB
MSADKNDTVPAKPDPEPTKKSMVAAPDPAPRASAGTAKDKLRGFEDAHFGKNAVRIRGHIEKGYGSPFKDMPAEKHAEYAALEKLVEAEAKVDEANAALSAAKSNHDTALAALALATKASETAAAEARKQADEDAKDAAKPAPARAGTA